MRRGERITENKSNSVRSKPQVGIRIASSQLGTSRPSNFAPDRALRPAALRAASRGPSSPVAARQRPPRGRGDSRGAGPGRCRPADTHLPSRPAPRPRRGSSPGAALPGGRRLRSAGPRRGRPRAPDRPRRTWRQRRRIPLLLLRPASPSLPAGVRRARGPARSFSARRRRRGSRGPGSGRGAGGRQRFRAQGSGSGRGSGSVRACERACQSRPPPQHRPRGVEAERPRVKHGGRPYWKRARAAGSGRWPARGGARLWAPPPPCRHLGSPPVRPSAPELFGPNSSSCSQRPTAPKARREGSTQTQPVTDAPTDKGEEGGRPGPSRQNL